MTVILPTPFEHLVEKDDKINEVWYRRLSELVTDTNRISSALASITTASTVTLTLATQADQEATTATAALVTPSVQQYHPSAAKAWGTIAMAGTVATVTTGYNIAGAVSTATGVLAVTLGTPFSSSNYTILPSAASPRFLGAVVGGIATTGFTLVSLDSTLGFSDPTVYFIACYGDQ
jgi:hypothetical protein